MSSRGSAAAGPRPLVIGYGNPFRGDDAVGWLVAEALLGDQRADSLDVLAVHQLNPEHAVRVAEAARVVVVDSGPGAGSPLAPGHWAVRRAAGGWAPVRRQPPAPGWGRSCTPEALAALAVDLFRSLTPIYLVEVGVASLEPGEQPGLPVLQAVPWLVELVLDLATGDLPADAGGAGAVQLSGDPGIPAGRPRGGSSRPA
jgi:hypothetical protein